VYKGISIDRDDDGYTLTFECDTPVDHVVIEIGDEPNGHFWETVAAFVEPRAVGRVDLDSEGSMFAAYGKRRHLNWIGKSLTPLLTDADKLRAVLCAAKAKGFTVEG
jgi:hypothetical protein